MDQTEPDPDITPDPETSQTGLSASEPEKQRFPGIGAVVAGAVLIVVLVVVAIVVAIWVV